MGWFRRKSEKNGAGVPLGKQLPHSTKKSGSGSSPEGSPISLQVLFPNDFIPNEEELLEEMHQHHSSMSRGSVSNLVTTPGAWHATVNWGIHRANLVGFALPMPTDAVEKCVQPAHFPASLKKEARAHQSHCMMFYDGGESDVFEQYIALALLAGVLAKLGGIVVVNAGSRISFPAAALKGETLKGEVEADTLPDILRVMLMLHLFCGYNKYHVKGVDGIWARTHGANRFGFPEFAYHAQDDREAGAMFEVFEQILNYLRESQAEIESGHTLQIEEETYLKFRRPEVNDPFHEEADHLLILEKISADQINDSDA